MASVVVVVFVEVLGGRRVRRVVLVLEWWLLAVVQLSLSLWSGGRLRPSILLLVVRPRSLAVVFVVFLPRLVGLVRSVLLTLLLLLWRRIGGEVLRW